jgi:hypothetical protein
MPLRHLGSTLQPEPLDDGRRTGGTAWGAVHDGRLIALAWDWLEILPGVLCLVDPARVVTNLRFQDARQRDEAPLQAIVSANLIVHRTAWQPTVLAWLGSHARAGLRAA